MEALAYGPDACIYFSEICISKADISNQILMYDLATGKSTEFATRAVGPTALFRPARPLHRRQWGQHRRQPLRHANEKDGKTAVLAEKWNVKRLNSPNDLIIDAKGLSISSTRMMSETKSAKSTPKASSASTPT